MSPLVKAVLNATVKPAADKLIANLQANEARNIADIEADVATGTTVATAVLNKLVGEIKASPIVEGAVDLLAPALESELATALGTAGNSVPALYAAGLAFLQKEDSYL